MKGGDELDKVQSVRLISNNKGFSQPSPQATHHSLSTMTNLHPAYLHIRDALPGDVDALAAIIRYAMPMDPQWDYRFPLRKQYPEDNYGYTRLMMKSFLEAQGVVVKVVTFPAPGLPEEDEVPAALAVWEVEPDKDKKYSLTPTAGDKTARRDANFEHMAAFGSTTRAARETYFNSVYQSRQLHLRILATLPEFQRKGAGTALCRWGIERAKQHQVPVTLLSSPLGHALYSSLGFTDIATITVQVKEEEEKLSIRVMVYPYEPVY